MHQESGQGFHLHVCAGDADDGGRVLVCAVVKCSYYNKLIRDLGD